MSEITKENYLHEMFINDVKGALGQNGGGGSSTPVPTGPSDNRTDMSYWYGYTQRMYFMQADYDTYETAPATYNGYEPIEELAYPIGTQNAKMFGKFLSIMMFDDLAGNHMEHKIPFVKKFIGELDMSSATNACDMFRDVDTVEDIGVLKGFKHIEDCSRMFYSCDSLTTIIMPFPPKNANNTEMFRYCRALANVTPIGEIECNGLSFQDSSNLTLESLRSILNALKDYSQDTSGTQWKITLGATNIAKLSDDDLLIAEKKGWIIA